VIYTVSIIGLILLVLFILWRFRANVIDALPPSLSSRLRHYAPLSTFEDAAENGTHVRFWNSRYSSLSAMFSALGFSTAAFDLSGNLAGDARAGLDERTLTEVRRVMEQMSCGFDEARAIHTKRIFAKNGESRAVEGEGYHQRELIVRPLQVSIRMDSRSVSTLNG
jgi:hypothetical protein